MFRGGATYDIGIYVIQLATMVFRGAPLKVSASGVVNEQGNDIAASITLQYPDGGHASLLIDTRAGSPKTSSARVFFFTGGEFISVHICGPFWCPDRLELTRVNGEVVVEEYPQFPNADKSDGLNFNYNNSQALAFEANAFTDKFEEWKQSKSTGPVIVEHPLRSHKDTLIDASIIDQVMAQIKAAN